jgi:hypothetical protein
VCLFAIAVMIVGKGSAEDTLRLWQKMSPFYEEDIQEGDAGMSRN